MSFAAIAIGGAALGVTGSIIGATRKNKAAKKLREGSKEVYKGLQEANQQYLGDYASLVEQGVPTANLTGLDLSNAQVRSNLDLSALDLQTALQLDDSVNRTDINELVSSAMQGQKQAQTGRLSGAEMQRDTVRQSSADALARARNIGGSALDLLGSLGAIQGAESEAMRNVDITELNRRQSAIDTANQRVDRALSQRVAFDQDTRNFRRQAALAEFGAAREAEMFGLDALRQAQIAEFGAEREAELTELQYQRQGELAQFDALRQSELVDYQRDLSQFDLQRDLLGAEQQARLNELSQLGAVYGARSAVYSAQGDMWSSIGQGVSGLSGTAMNQYNNNQMMDLMKMLG